MSETDNDKPKLGMRAPLGVKRTVETGKVKQSFSHGRSNTVVVEVKRRRVIGKPGEAEAAPVAPPPAPPAPVQRQAPPPVTPPRRPQDSLLSRQELQAKLLREAEEARMSALEDARRREEQDRAQQSDEERRRAEENRREQEEAERRAAEAARQPAEPQPEPEVPAEAVAPAADAAPDAPATPATPAGVALDANRPAPRRFEPVVRQAPPPAPPRRPEPAKPTRDRKTDDRRQSGKLTVNRALDDSDGGARARSLAALKRAREKEKRAHGGPREAHDSTERHAATRPLKKFAGSRPGGSL